MPYYKVVYRAHLEGSETIKARNKSEAQRIIRETVGKKLISTDAPIPGTDLHCSGITVVGVIPQEASPTFLIYTDGGYHQYKDEGAYAYIILKDDKIIRKDAKVIRHESNNRGELKAIIEAVASCPPGAILTIRSDSQYAINTLMGVWRRNTNLDLFEKWEIMVKEKNPDITFEWVRGHSGDRYNEMCDHMCDEAVGYDLNSWIPKKK